MATAAKGGKKKSKKEKKAGPKRTKTEEEIIEVFEHFDQDNSGCVDLAELKQMLFELGQNPTDEEVQAIMNEVDTDKNGTIDKEEFIALMVNCLKDSEEVHDEMFEAFSVFDRNGDGVIDKSELEYVLRNVGPGLPKKTIDYVFNKMDSDGSGTIDYPEFCKIMEDGGFENLAEEEEKKKPSMKGTKKKRGK